MAHYFDHRWNSYYGTGNDDRHRLKLAEKQDPALQAEPRYYWILENGLIPTRRNGRDTQIPVRLGQVAVTGWRDGPDRARDRAAAGLVR